MIARSAAAHEAPTAPHHSADPGVAVVAGQRISAASHVMPTFEFQPGHGSGSQQDPQAGGR